MDLNLKENQKAQRKLLATYVDVSTTGEYQWELIGAGVEESAIEYNNEVNSITDILGITETDITKNAPKQTLEPFTVRGGSLLHQRLLDILRRNALSELSLFNVMVVEGYLGEEGKLAAEVHAGCTIEVESKGGSGTVDLPISIYFSNDKTLGTVEGITKSPTFTQS